MNRGVIGKLLIIAGIVVLSGNYIFAEYREIENEKNIEKIEWSNLVENKDATPISTQVLQGDILKEVSNSEFTQKVVAILEIPNLSIRYPICIGVDDVTLKHSLGFFPNTALPGQLGNFVVAGHRNSRYGKYFRELDKIKVGDSIFIKTRDNEFEYKVTGSEVVHKGRVDVLEQDDSKKEITLITCTNGYKPKNRIVVKGVLN